MAEVVRTHPVGGVDYPNTFQQLLAWFPDDAACLNYLAGLRWPDGFVCPACGSNRYWRTATARWMCADCDRQTSVTAGTDTSYCPSYSRVWGSVVVNPVTTGPSWCW
jgi:predicted RNA-binding Zn-ribbon protein involved in translation (DUF1610 family)